jgi:ACS family hexuronate transporter-like MFS transporter
VSNQDLAVETLGKSGAGGFRIPHFRWGVAVMLFLAAVLNYIDRQALSILAPTIQKDLGLTDNDYATVANYFLLAYTISLLLSGRLVDKIGTRIGMAFFVSFWSLANMLTATSHSLQSLSFYRFLLGLGEAGNWPASTKVVSEWFTAKERAVAAGFYTMGATIGATVAPLILITVVAYFGDWHSAFVVTGLLGFVWVVPWLVFYSSSPATNKWITQKERDYLAADKAAAAAQAAVAAPVVAAAAEPAVKLTELQRWGSVFSRVDVWLLMIARFLTDSVWFFYQIWFVKYLIHDRGISQQGATVTWVVYLAADIGALGGGLLSAYLIKRGFSAPAGRLWAMAACAIVMPLSPLVAHAGSLWVCLLVASVIVLAHLAWLVNISALVIDLMPKPILATAFGVIAMGSSLGAMIMNKAVAGLVTNYSYSYWFYIAGGLHVIAWLMLFAGRVHRRPAAAVMA